MSFIGSIGMCLKSFGLEKLLVQAYSGENVVSHMLSAKAISRALRGLYLVDSALRAILFNIFEGEKENSEEEHTEEIPMDPVAIENLTIEEIDEMTETSEEINFLLLS